MCGINVVINGTHKEIELMTSATSKRGVSNYFYKKDNIHVGFNWLPITDDTNPPPYTAGKYHVWLNGYISNYKELIDKYNLNPKSKCDSEVLALFIDKFGFDKLQELNGFFSVVVLVGGRVHTFTDRYGIKQLYNYKEGNTHYISSEVKGILAVKDLELDTIALADWEYSLGIMTDNTIYKNVYKSKTLSFQIPMKIDIPYDEAKEILEIKLLRSCFRNKYKEDGVFLSGGIDSGILAKILNPKYSFSMDYLDQRSEIDNIKLNSIGEHYTMIHNEGFYNKYKDQAINALDDLKAGSCYTNYAISELASKFCKVVYSGAGGDEIFNGYTHRYNKPIGEVICRNKEALIKTKKEISHKEYDWRFLKGILIVEDRMGGANTLETRYPLLDNDLVDFCLSLPNTYINNKRILKDVSGLNDEVINGKKKGFSNPITNKEWIEEVLRVKGIIK